MRPSKWSTPSCRSSRSAGAGSARGVVTAAEGEEEEGAGAAAAVSEEEAAGEEGAAGGRATIEPYMTRRECSIVAFTDIVRTLPSCSSSQSAPNPKSPFPFHSAPLLFFLTVF